MRPTESGKGIVFEGNLEAQVAAQILDDAGRPNLIAAFEPPLDQPGISRTEFQNVVSAERQRHRDGIIDAEYIVDEPLSLEVFVTLVRETPHSPPPEIRTKNMRVWMGQRITEWSEKFLARYSAEEILQSMTTIGIALAIARSNNRDDRTS